MRVWARRKAGTPQRTSAAVIEPVSRSPSGKAGSHSAGNTDRNIATGWPSTSDTPSATWTCAPGGRASASASTASAVRVATKSICRPGIRPASAIARWNCTVRPPKG